jgi:aconitate hydratase
MPYTVSEKIIRSHLLEGSLERGSPILLRIDQTLTQDLTGILVCQFLDAVGPERLGVERMCVYADHKTVETDAESADDHRFLKTTAEHYGAIFSKNGNGICHFLQCQRFAAPGKTLLGSDSHTPTSGALGMLAIGSGGLTVAESSLGMGFRMPMPRIMNIRLRRALRPGCAAKDAALEMLRRLRVTGGRGFILEFSGEGVQSLSVSQRQTLCNMSIETGAYTGIFPSDENTRSFLRAQQREEDYIPLLADEGAVYDEELELDLSALEPLVARPSMPDNVAPVRETELCPDSVFIGSCTNGSYQDIARAAQILRGRKVHPDIDLTVGPGSRQVLRQLLDTGVLQVLLDAGARILECSCGPCIGIGQVPPYQGVTVRTSNRNFPGRSGSKDASVYLVSPETAAATAVTGRLTDPRELLPESFEPVEEPFTAPVDDSALLRPADPHGRRDRPIQRGPGISELPTRGPLRDQIEGVIGIITGDGVTTDDIIPSTPETNRVNADIPRLAEYTFLYLDPGYAARARAAGCSAIVGGENYGQGSSRESAALLPMFLGVELVLARSYARIHRENLINYGILPLTFARQEDYALLRQGERFVLRDVMRGLERGELLLELPDRDLAIPALLTLNEYEKRVLRLGGALNDLKQNAQGGRNAT